MARKEFDPYAIIYSKDLEVVGTKSTTGDTTVISAPGDDKEIVIKEIQIQAEATGGVTVFLEDGSATRRRIRCQDDGYGITVAYQGEDMFWHWGENKALVLDLSSAVAVNYYIRYDIRNI